MQVIEDDDQAVPLGDLAHRAGHFVEYPEPVARGFDVAGEQPVGVAPERPEHLTPRPVGRRALRRHASAPGDRGADGEGVPGELLSEPGLADTRFADAEHEAAGAVQGTAEPGPQRVELTLAPDDAITHELCWPARRTTHAT